ncbi:hypothetical protein B0A50_04007 [Salinomyces thailandicus]|uniref:C3H1-type domain-containing protein n=1 Tax=Salinomyces thailandicus TaxID=706561 RepID=A0A4U0U0H0_9PEZI|nr:hypothetical protein B0A50_04007 [Salinomyces thailandica]
MAICKFFLEGRCRFGDSCKNEHPREQNQGNRFAPLSNQGGGGRARSGGYGGGGGGGGDRYRPGQQNSGRDQSLPYHLNADIIRSDLTTGGADGEKPTWPLSCYGPGRDAPRQLLEGIIEQSPEECRVLYYQAQAAGQLQEYATNETNAVNQAIQQAQSVLNDLDGAIKYVLDGAHQHPNRLDQVVQNKQPSLARAGGSGQPSGSSSFGQAPADSGASAFGRPSGLGGGSAFGQPSQAGRGGSAFGQASQVGGGTGFGKPSALGGQPAFGQPSPAGGSAFGAPSALGGTGSAFGKPSGLGGNSVFGQASQPAFGQSSFGKPDFGQASQPTGGQPQQQQTPFSSQSAQPSPFAAAAGQSSGFGAASQAQQLPTNPFAQAGGAQQSSGFGAAGSQPGSNPFANKPASIPAFGQPSQPANGFGLASQQNNSGGGFGSGFGQSSRVATSESSSTPFGAPSQTSAGSNSGFGSAAAPNTAPPPQQPKGTFSTGPSATSHYTTRTANGTLQTWKKQPVRYDEANNPSFLNPSTRKSERIWHPNGPPLNANPYAEAPPEVYTTELVAMLKEAYDHVSETGTFKDGIMPEIPPKREWVRWDL